MWDYEGEGLGGPGEETHFVWGGGRLNMRVWGGHTCSCDHMEYGGGGKRGRSIRA